MAETKSERPVLARTHAPGQGLRTETAASFLASTPTDEAFGFFAKNMTTMCCMMNADGSVFWYNQRWIDYVGLTAEAIEGGGWHVLHHPDVQLDVARLWQEAVASGQSFEMTVPLKGHDGQFREFLTRIDPLHDDEGTVTRWLCISTDVSAAVAIKRELAIVNAQYQAVAAEREALLSQLGESVIVADPSGRVTFMNEAAALLHGCSTLDTTPEGYADAYGLLTMAGEVHPIETLPMTRAIRDLETVTNAEWRIRRPDGSEVCASGNARPFYGADGVLIGAVLSIRDESNRHAADLALAEVARLKELLLHEVNHRVKNSLQLVTSMLSLQATKSDSADLKRSLNDAMSRILVVSAIHHRLYSSGEHDRVDLSSYLRDLANETIRALDDKNRVDINFDGTPDVFIDVDRAIPLALVMSELLTNAVKYAFTGMPRGTIAMAVVANDKDIVITLSDDGCGLPADFDPKKGGSLGMRIVAALTGQLSAKLAIVRPDRGTCFEIRLPINRGF